MTKFNEVANTIEHAAIVLFTEKVELLNSINRVLQEDIVADMDMPPFDKSAMDGYACRKEDLENELEILEIIQAGKLPKKVIGKNQCSKIMTGATVPPGADCVFMIEDTNVLNEKFVKCNNPQTKDNICFEGEDYKNGDILVEKGVKISPSHIGILAGAGYAEVLVSKTPNVALIATGTELVEPILIPSAGQIRNSNSYQLMAQLQSMSIPYNYIGIIADDFEQISASFEKSIADNDIVIITGGTSNGDFDFVPGMLRKHDFEILVDKTGIQPGNPMTFSKKHQKYCFGLSGNPVSSFVQFELFVKPFLYKLMGSEWQQLLIKGTLSKNFYRKKPGRFGIIPVKLLEGNIIEEIDFHGSAHINALGYANALMEVPENVTLINEGEAAYVRPI